MKLLISPLKSIFACFLVSQLLLVQVSGIIIDVPIIPSLVFLALIAMIVVAALNHEFKFSIKLGSSESYFLLLSFYILLSYLIVSNSSWSNQKVVYYFLLVFFPALIFIFNKSALSIFYEKIKLITFFSKMSILFSLLLVFLGLAEYFDGNRLMGVGVGNPIWFGRLIAIPVIFLFFYERKKISSLFCIMIGLYLIYLTSSRAVLLGVLVSFHLILGFSLRRPHFYFSLSSLVFIVPILYYLIFVIDLNFSNYNIGNVFSIIERFNMWEQGVNIIKENLLFGVGFGDYGYAVTGDINVGTKYPHNIIIEIFIELGLLGVLLFILFCFSVLKQRGDNPLYFLFVFFVFNSMFSADIYGNNHLFWFGVSCSLCKRLESEFC